ncbi:MAG: patatin-like phospholipase family protein [Parvicellaceae bacterium]
MEDPTTIPTKKQQSSFFSRVLYFFPFQLLLLHLKRNHVLLLFWLLLFLYVTNVFGKNFGIVSLFLAPEYSGDINVYSFVILGFALGGFIMAFHIYSYILFSSEFLFLATLARPFLKFCLNNMIIPLLFVLTLIVNTYFFLIDEQLLNALDVVFYISSLLLGLTLFYFMALIYFIRFNKNVYAISGKSEDYYNTLWDERVRESSLMKKKKISSKIKENRNKRIETYMSGILKISLARNTDHYERALIDKVFAQNHINASFFEIALIVTFVSLGLLREYDLFNIPAGASILLLFTLLIMVFSAIYSFLKGWTMSICIAVFFLFNFVSNQYGVFRFHNYAYGIDYSKKVAYSYDDLAQNVSDDNELDFANEQALTMLNNWKAKNTSSTEAKKPKMIFLNISGGGLRSALWSIHVMNYLDSISNNKLFKQTQLVTGASGGMIGAAYYREMKHLESIDSTYLFDAEQLKRNISKDLLNQLAFSIATTDMLIRFQSFHDGNYSYTKDRGWFFEEKLTENLSCFDGKRLQAYEQPELQSEMPMMIFSPSVVNDGRRMLISAQPVSYLTQKNTDNFTSSYSSIEDLEFNSLFSGNNSKNIKMTSVLRMNATFPYILPMVLMPTEPSIELMDAGIRDNFGTKTSLSFIHNFKKWINRNTSGVVIIQIRDKQKQFEVDNPNSGSLLTTLLSPFTNVYKNLLKVHDYNNDQHMNTMGDWFGGEVDLVTIYMNQEKDDEISMSWHLTPRDKIRIYNSINSNDNKKSFQKLQQLLNY